jgi:hypothetical protein
VAVDSEGGTGLRLGCSKADSVLCRGGRVVDGSNGCVEYDDVGRDIEDLNIDGVELFLLCLIGSLTGRARSGSEEATVGLTAREAVAGGDLETRKGILTLNCLLDFYSVTLGDIWRDTWIIEHLLSHIYIQLTLRIPEIPQRQIRHHKTRACLLFAEHVVVAPHDKAQILPVTPVSRLITSVRRQTWSPPFTDMNTHTFMLSISQTQINVEGLSITSS